MLYKVYKSKVIEEKVDDILGIMDTSKDIHSEFVGGDSTTWTYERYNVFGLTSPTNAMYDLYCELKDICYEFTKEERLWCQAWLNYHNVDEVLDWHDHAWPYHGYISIRPHNTRTVFDKFEIKNEVGNIYIGKGFLRHKVIVDEPWDPELPRITLGFDLKCGQMGTGYNIRPQPSYNTGLMPFPK